MTDVVVRGAQAPNGEGDLVEIDPSAPWAGWVRPVAVQSDVSKLSFAVDDVHMPAGGARLVLEGPDFSLYPTPGAMVDFSTRVGFPYDFITKLTPGTQAAVLNERLRDARESRFTMTTQPYMQQTPDGQLQPHELGFRIVTNISPGWRGIASHPEICQTAFNIMSDTYGPDGVTVKTARMTDQGLELRMVTDYSLEVSKGGRRLGDVVSLGVVVTHRYGMEICVALYIERLVCLNGMTTTKSEYEWRSKALGSAASQLEYIQVGIAGAVTAFEAVVDRARLMSETRVEGDLERLLIERARAMRLPRNHDTALLEAWRMEPVPTEWGFLNALTRFATHSTTLNERQRAQIQAGAGRWTEGFDLVSARMPRPLALQVGATIYEDAHYGELQEA